jgi:hypothetical protein
MFLIFSTAKVRLFSDMAKQNEKNFSLKNVNVFGGVK